MPFVPELQGFTENDALNRATVCDYFVVDADEDEVTIFQKFLQTGAIGIPSGITAIMTQTEQSF